MEAELIWQDEAESLMLVHGTGAIGALVSRISDAVRLCDDQAVRKLDHMLQLVEARLEEPWRLPVARLD
jgi:hypothetical protein